MHVLVNLHMLLLYIFLVLCWGYNLLNFNMVQYTGSRFVISYLENLRAYCLFALLYAYHRKFEYGAGYFGLAWVHMINIEHNIR